MPELAPESAINSNLAWRAHADPTAHVEVATLDELEWADAYAFGTPVRFGTAGPWWAKDVLANKPVTAFTSAINRHGGNESTLLALTTRCTTGVR